MPDIEPYVNSARCKAREGLSFAHRHRVATKYAELSSRESEGAFLVFGNEAEKVHAAVRTIARSSAGGSSRYTASAVVTLPTRDVAATRAFYEQLLEIVVEAEKISLTVCQSLVFVPFVCEPRWSANARVRLMVHDAVFEYGGVSSRIWPARCGVTQSSCSRIQMRVPLL